MIPRRSCGSAPAALLPAILLLIIILILIPSCGGGGVPEDAPAETLNVPGTLTGPDGLRPDFALDTALVVYYWMPLDGYASVDSDLVSLSGLPGRGVRAIPVQFTVEGRNAAQAHLNSMGISMPVYLADSVLASCIPSGVLPAAVLFRRGSPPAVGTGFGCAERLLAR